MQRRFAVTTAPNPAEVLEVLILLAPNDEGAAAAAPQAVEDAGGRVLLSYGPHAVVAVLDADTIGELRRASFVLAVETGAVPDDRARNLPPELRDAAAVWNQHVAARGQRKTPTGNGLAWDAPGFLPPDPPPEIRELLRRREEDASSRDE
jgi:hypothetical protein